MVYPETNYQMVLVEKKIYAMKNDRRETGQSGRINECKDREEEEEQENKGNKTGKKLKFPDNIK